MSEGREFFFGGVGNEGVFGFAGVCEFCDLGNYYIFMRSFWYVFSVCKILPRIETN